MEPGIDTGVLADDLLDPLFILFRILWSLRSNNDLLVRSYAAFIITTATQRATSGSKIWIWVNLIRTRPIKTPSEV